MADRAGAKEKAQEHKKGSMEGHTVEGGHKNSVEDGAGMTQKGVDKYKRDNPGSDLKTAVTEDNPGPKDAARRKSFCARSKGWTGERGKAARKRWKC